MKSEKVETRGRKRKQPGIAEEIKAKKKIINLTSSQIKKIELDREKIFIVQRDYQITTSKLYPHQLELKDKASETYRAWFDGKYIHAPKYKYVVFQSGNGAGKSYWLYYMVSRFAIGKQNKNYKLDYIGFKKNIVIVTQSGANVKDYVEKYLLGDFSPCRIPPDLIDKISRGPDHIKEIKLKNGCIITIKTVEQGQKRLVGSNPDLLVIDEPIENDLVWAELLARLRGPTSQLLYGFTPINGYNSSYFFLYEQQDDLIKRRTFIGRYSSYLNTSQDHSTLNAFDENQRAVRIYGDFMPREGLVYNKFNRYANVIPHLPQFRLKELGPCDFYCGLDVGVHHPTGITFIAVDADGKNIVISEHKESNMLIEDIAKTIKKFAFFNKIEFKRIVIDSAGQREKLELRKYGIFADNARKQEKGGSGENNRKASILLLNQLFSDRNLLIYDTCTSLIKELGTHSYKDGGKRDGEVNKINDDILDSLRYVLWYIKPKKVKEELGFVTDYQKRYGPDANIIKLKKKRKGKTW